MNIRNIIKWLGRNPVNLKQIHNEIIVGRNETCQFCASGKKYKRCCLSKVDAALSEESHIVREEREKDAVRCNKIYKRITGNEV